MAKKKKKKAAEATALSASREVEGKRQVAQSPTQRALLTSHWPEVGHVPPLAAVESGKLSGL